MGMARGICLHVAGGATRKLLARNTIVELSLCAVS